MELFRSGNVYFNILRKRAKRSRIYSRHQLLGLLIAAYLDDFAHKSLYMRLAKLPDADYLLQVAKEVSRRKKVKNKGAYFMKIITAAGLQWKSSRSEQKNTKKSSAKKQRSLLSLISRKKKSKS